MLPIYLFAGQSSQLQQYQVILSNILFMEDYTARVVLCTSSPEQLILNLSARITNEFPREALYMIDTDFHPSCNLFQLIREIRHLDARGFIVLITQNPQSTDFALQYHVEPLDIIPKHESWNLGLRMNQCIAESLRRSAAYHSRSLFSFTIKKVLFQIPFQEILYITAAVHKLTLVTLYESYEFYGTLTNCMEQLDEHFLFSHRAFIVNTTQIASINKETLIITFHNGQTCIASLRGMRRLISTLKRIS